MDASQVAFLASVLINTEEFKVDWEKVAVENGINRKDNCTTKFKNVMKNYGVDFTKNTFSAIQGHDFAAAKVPTTPKTQTHKKRKNTGEAGGDVATGSPKKKTKAKKEPALKAEEVDDNTET